MLCRRQRSALLDALVQPAFSHDEGPRVDLRSATARRSRVSYSSKKLTFTDALTSTIPNPARRGDATTTASLLEAAYTLRL